MKRKNIISFAISTIMISAIIFVSACTPKTTTTTLTTTPTTTTATTTPTSVNVSVPVGPAPMVTSTYNANGAMNVPVNTKIGVFFTKAMDPLTINTGTFLLQQGSTPVAGTVTLASYTATLTPAVTLTPNTVYTATITTGAKDLDGNALVIPYVWSFTTAASPDTVPPWVTGTINVNGAINVSINTKIGAFFTEVMDPLTINNNTFTVMQGTTPVDGTVNYIGLAATFTPTAALTPNSIYIATITTGAKDLVGNALVNPYIWSFTTGAAPDTTPPTVSSTIPLNGSTSMAANSALAAVFSEAMDPLTVTTATFTLTQGTTSVSGVVTYLGMTATFTPAASLTANVVYTATITTGAKDLAGNAVAANYTWTFSSYAGGGGSGGGGGQTPSSAKALTTFSFIMPAVTGVINESAKTVAVTVPFGTPLTGLVATFTTTGTGVTVGTTVQTSLSTPNNFTNPVPYIVTAADMSTVTYTVTVSIAANSAKAITAYSFAGFTGAVGTINEANKTIAVTMPFGTPVTALVATFTTTGTGVKVGTTVQTSLSTPNNFTSPVAYIVTAADTSTVTYTVTVSIAANSAKAITAYSFAGFTGAVGTINEANKTISVTVPFGTPVTALVATFTTTGTGVKVGTTVQTSTATPNNFTSPVAYIVTAGDASTVTYTVTVSVAANSAKAITAYSFAGFTGAVGTINEANKTIAVTVPFGTPVTALVATFTTTGTGVMVGSTVQTSTATPNNFTSPVAYIVTAGDASTATYTVTVSVAANSVKAITAYSFAGFTGAVGTINESAKTILVTVPFGTPVTALVATFTTTGTSVMVGATVQTSTATPNNFTSPVAYVVTAGDASTVTYTVTVSAAANSAKAITAYSFAGFTGAVGTINEANKTIAVTVPFGTPVIALVATFTTTGTSVMVGTTVQTSNATPNNFTSPVAYIVTAGDASTVTYTVTVNVAANSAKAITAYSFAGLTGAVGTIDEVNKTIAVTVPYGTPVTALVATFTTTGTTVMVGTTIQTSTATPNNFTNPVAYIVTAADNSTVTYTVTVTITQSIPLGLASTFAIMATSAISGSGNHITGDVGLNPGSAQGIAPSEITGTIHVDDTAAIAAQASLLAAFNDAVSRSINAQTLQSNLGGLTKVHGLYVNGSSSGISGTGANAILTLDAGGDANAVFIFKMSSTFIMDPGTSIVLSGNAQAKNVYFWVGSSATLDTTTIFKGNILAAVTITVNNGSNIVGRLFAGAGGGTGAVTVQSSTIAVPAP